jgi:prepilin-type N-terminal cleavage/methylation domain-containing protein
MTRKSSMHFRRLPVDFRDEPSCAVPIVRRNISRRTSDGGESHSPNAFVLDFGYSNFKIHNSKFNSRGFTLVEILVVLVLLSLIVFALMAVFSATQRAFRASLTQSDTLQGGRSVMDLIAADLQSMTPSDASSNTFVNGILYAPVNFYINEQTSPQLSPPMPLFQSIITSPSGSEVTNILENIFILSKNNINGVPTWVGTGYSVNTNLPDGTLYPLYRFYMTTNLSSGIFGPVGLFNAFYSSQYTNSTIWSHLMDGVVRLTAQAYDTNGVVMTNGYMNPQNSIFTAPSSFHVRFVRFKQDQYGVVDSVFYSNAVPASVQIELGTLEDRTLQHAEGLSGANQSNYLAGAAGQLHVFRQRVWIRNLDPTAYQQ